MRRLLAVLLVLGVAGLAGAANLTNHNIVPDKATYVGDNMGDTREGGETWGSAVVIGSLPYSDSGATCDNIDDITLPCAASSAPDVVYRYTAGPAVSVNVSMCGSSYDTALGIYDGNQNNVACNDDFCGLQSEIDNINIPAGATYYFVVDGFSTNCGSYVINVSENQPCILECPAGAMLEGEPPCGDNYYDAYNGGCNSTGWTPICPQSGNTAVVCGKSGTYLYNGFSYRDTDWYQAWGMGGTMTATCRAEFPLQLIFIYVANCNNLQYDLITAGVCQDAVLSRYVAMDTEVWIWVGASQFNGIPCESDYILTMDGIFAHVPTCQPIPVQENSWGAIKNLYR